MRLIVTARWHSERTIYLTGCGIEGKSVNDGIDKLDTLVYSLVGGGVLWRACCSCGTFRADQDLLTRHTLGTVKTDESWHRASGK